MTDLDKAKQLLSEGDFTCVLRRDDQVFTATARGVRPLLDWVEAGRDFSGFSAADRVVGRGAAFLYCLLQVQAVYARVMSEPAAAVLAAGGIHLEAEKLVDGIINRQCDGPCPFEAAVMDIQEPEQALEAIRAQMAQMRKSR